MHTAVGHSDDIDTPDAIAAVIAQCETQLGAHTPRAALLFASPTYDHQTALDRVAARWPGIALIGGSTDGEMSSRGGFTRDSLLLVVLAGDGFEARVGLGRNLSADTKAAVAQALSVQRAEPPVLCLTAFAPSTDSTVVVQQLQAALAGGRSPVLGGLSADHRDYSRMVEFCGREVLRDSLPVLLLYGDVKVSWGLGSGWFPIGDCHRVTASDGHIVHTIDGEPATAIFERYWGNVPKDSLGEYPLAVYPNGESGNWVLRAALASTETGSIRFAGDVPQGAVVRLTEVLPEGILSGSTRSIESALRAFPGGQPGLALMFSCAARRWVLGTQAEEEYALLAGVLRQHAVHSAQVAGFYCYGEIAPFEHGGATAFHNETCVSVLLG